MNARKLPSGRWQTIVYIGKQDGKKRYKSVTADSKKEALFLAAQVQAAADTSPKITVDQAVTKYIDARRGVLSPSTVAGYLSKQKLYITPFPIASVRLDQLTSQKVQKWISAISADVKKKTVAHAYGLFSAAVRMFVEHPDIAARLPQGKRFDGYVPSTDEVLKVIAAAKEYDPRLYRACLLSAFATLRRGEISCLTAEDLKGNLLRIEKDMVKDEAGRWIVKLPKTETSVRTVPLPQWVVDEMPKEGPLVDYRPDEITKWFGRVLKRLDVPHFRFHDLRKFSVSLMATQGVSMASIKEIGGWSNLQTPQQIYIKALADAHQREMAGYLDHLNSLKV
jgi:integrase